MGKTAFALTMARNIAVDHNTPIGFFSLEMSSEQLVNRLIASEAELGASKLRKGDLADHEMVQLHEKIKHLSEAPIFIDDTPGYRAGLQPNDLISKIDDKVLKL
jgi:replicative DNA helicase